MLILVDVIKKEMSATRCYLRDGHLQTAFLGLPLARDPSRGYLSADTKVQRKVVSCTPTTHQIR